MTTRPPNTLGQGRAAKRAVSDDFGHPHVPSEQSVGAQISSEGALLGSALGEARVEAGFARPEFRHR
jgi:hypothetical protein